MRSRTGLVQRFVCEPQEQLGELRDLRERLRRGSILFRGRLPLHWNADAVWKHLRRYNVGRCQLQRLQQGVCGGNGLQRRPVWLHVSCGNDELLGVLRGHQQQPCELWGL